MHSLWTAKALYDAVVARYSSPATAAIGKLLLPYLFPELSAFAIVADLVTHLRTSDARYGATVLAEFLAMNLPPMFITLYFIVSRLPDSLRSIKDHFLSLDPTYLTVDLLEQHLLAAETSAVAVGAARGTPRSPFFEGCSPSTLSPSFASAAASDVSVTEDVSAALTSAERRSSKGKGGRGGGGGSGGGGGGSGSGGGDSGGGGGGSGGGGGGGTGGGSGGSGGGSGGSGVCGGSGGGGTGGGRFGPRRGGPGGGQRQQQQCRSETQSPQRLCVRTGQTCRRLHNEHRCFARLDDAWRAEFGDDVERPRRTQLLQSGVAIFDLDYDAIISAMCALSFSAEGDCYRCVPPDPGIAAAALGASASGTPPGTAPPEALHSFTLDSGTLRFDDYTRYTTVFPLRSKGEVVDVLIPWIRTVRLQLREWFDQDLPVQRLHSDKGGDFSSNLLRDFCLGEGILQSFTLPDSPQINGIAKRRIGLVMEFYHPTSRRVLPSQDTTFDKSVPFYYLFPYRSAPSRPSPLFLAPDPLPGTAPVKVAVGPGASFGGAASGGAEPGGAGSEGARSGGAEPEGVEPGVAESEGTEPRGAASPGGPAGALPRLTLQQLREWLVRHAHRRSGAPGAGEAGDTGARGAAVTTKAGGTGGTAATGPGGARTSGAGAAGTVGVGCAGAGDPTEPGAVGVGGPGAGCVGAAGAGVGGTGARGAGAAGARAVDPGAGGAGDTVRPRPYFVPLLQQVLGVPSSIGLPPPFLGPPPDQLHPPLQPASPLPAPSPYTKQSGGLTERRELASRPVSPVRIARCAPRSRPPPVPGTHTMALRPSSVPLRVPLLAPPVSSLPELFDFVAACRLDYASALVAESVPASPPSVGGECALGTDVLEDKKEDFECLAAAVPRFASMQLAPEGDADAPDIPTPRSYAEAITGTYVDAVPPPRANIVDGMWIFRVKQPPVSPPAFKARYVARGFTHRQGVDYFQTFSPTLKMTTLRHSFPAGQPARVDLAVLTTWFHWDVSCRYSVEPPPASLRSPPGASRVARHTEDDTCGSWVFQRFGFQFSSPQPTPLSTSHSLLASPSNESVEPSGPYPELVGCLMYLMTCTRADLAYPLSLLARYVAPGRHRKVLQRFGFQFSSPQPTPLSTSHSLLASPSDESVEPSGPYPELVGCLMYLMRCTRADLAYPLSLLARYVAPGRHRKVFQCFGFQFSSPQPTPLSTSHSLLAPPSDESVEPSGLYPELVGCLITLGMGLVLGGRGPVVLTGHVDASWVDDSAMQRSSQGYTFSLGSGSVSWQSTRSSSVLSSSCEAEIYAGAMAAQELRWLTYLVIDLGEQPRSPPVVYVDNKAMIALCQEHKLKHRTKHVALRYFLARELQQRGQLRLAYVATRANTAGVFSKVLPLGDHQRFATVLGLVPTLPHLLTA
ncbi:unnamed protein product [Closterium sp. NIES-53]